MDATRVRVLCVDDDADTAGLLEHHLSEHFECTVALDGDAAIELLERHGPFAVLVCDYLLPGTNGVELCKTVKQRWPDTVRVMITALNEQDVAIAALHEASVHRFVRKPWQAQEIVEVIRDAASHYQLLLNEKNLRRQLARTNAELDEKLQDLDEANQLLEYWVEFSPAVLYSLSYEENTLRVSYLSKNFLRLTGYERTAAVIDVDFWPALLVAGARPRYEKRISELLSGELTHAVMEYDIEHKSGSLIRIVDSLQAVHDGDGQTVEIVGAWMDVSARR